MKFSITLFLLALLLCGCRNSEPALEDAATDTTEITENYTAKTDTPTEPATHNPPETEPLIPVNNEHMQFIRTDGSFELLPPPYLVKIESREELAEYYALFAGIFDLEARPTYYSDYTIGWTDAIAFYDDAFFADRILYMAVLEEGSGSIRHTFLGIEDGYAKIGYSIPEAVTDDMACWHAFIPAVNPLRGLMLGENESRHEEIYTVAELSERLEYYLRDIAAGAVAGRIGEAHYATVTDIRRMTYGEAKAEEITNPHGYGGTDASPVWRITVESEGWEFKLYLNHSGSFVGEAKSNPIMILE